MELDADTVRLAQGKNLATIVTLMPDGQPQAQLRWIDGDEQVLLVNTEPQRQAARNLARDPRVTVLIHSCDDAYDWAEVRGVVEDTITGDQARAHIDRLAHKYTGADYQMPIGPQGRVLLRIRPQKVVTPRSLARG
jgi:PPOX class probable F420-dependent enzyme